MGFMEIWMLCTWLRGENLKLGAQKNAYDIRPTFKNGFVCIVLNSRWPS